MPVSFPFPQAATLRAGEQGSSYFLLNNFTKLARSLPYITNIQILRMVAKMIKIFNLIIKDDNGQERIETIRYKVYYDEEHGCYCWQRLAN